MNQPRAGAGGNPRADLWDEARIAGSARRVPKWTVLERKGVKQLERVFAFEDFAQALAFTNRVGELAEAEEHHPALLTEWGKVTVTWWTHSVGGLLPNDFDLAARTDQAYEGE